MWPIYDRAERHARQPSDLRPTSPVSQVAELQKWNIFLISSVFLLYLWGTTIAINLWKLYTTDMHLLGGLASVAGSRTSKVKHFPHSISISLIPLRNDYCHKFMKIIHNGYTFTAKSFLILIFALQRSYDVSEMIIIQEDHSSGACLPGYVESGPG